MLNLNSTTNNNVFLLQRILAHQKVVDSATVSNNNAADLITRQFLLNPTLVPLLFNHATTSGGNITSSGNNVYSPFVPSSSSSLVGGGNNKNVDVRNNDDIMTKMILLKQASMINLISNKENDRFSSLEMKRKLITRCHNDDRKAVVTEKKLNNNNNRFHIDHVLDSDVLCGRGGRVNRHPGNIMYRNIVSSMKIKYKNTISQIGKADLSRAIVQHVCNQGGRFIKKDEKSGKKFYILNQDEARRKTSQALREQQKQEIASIAMSGAMEIVTSNDKLFNSFCTVETTQKTEIKTSIVKKNRKKDEALLQQQHYQSPNRLYVDKVHDFDVLCGRGGRTNHHPGNRLYREIISKMKTVYRTIGEKNKKTDLSRNIVDHVCSYGGRFVNKDEKIQRYYILTLTEARKKASQALREK